MYAKIINNCINDASKTEKKGYESIAIDYDTFIESRARGLYKLGSYGVLLKNKIPVNKQLTYLIETEDKKVSKGLTVAERLQKAKEQFEKNINMNIKWKNGQYYKPRYASESYEGLLAAETILQIKTQGKESFFPKEIWDATKIHSAWMTANELEDLAKYLAAIYEKQFQEYKRTCAKIINTGDK